MKIPSLLLGSLALAIPAATASATVYNGNGGTGFGGNVGGGALTVTSNAAAGTYTFSLATGNGKTNLDSNSFVLYIDSVTGGFTNTLQFTDNADGGRASVSGYNTNTAPDGTTNPSRALVNFSSGFGADYGISFENGFVGMFGLAAGNNLNYVTGANQTSGASPFTLTVTAAQLGLTSANSILHFVGTYTSTAAYRSNEAVGIAIDNGTGQSLPSENTNTVPNPGFNSTITFSSALAYNPAAVPEPGAVACFGLGIVALVYGWRRSARA